MSESDNERSPAASGAAQQVKTVTISRRHAEGLVLVLIAAVAVFFAVGAGAIKSSSGDVVGPSTFPIAVAVLLLICVGAAFVALFRRPADETVTVKRPHALVSSMILLLAFAPLADLLGYYVVIVPWTLAFCWAARVRTPVLIGTTLIVVLVLAGGVFDALLGTPLP